MAAPSAPGPGPGPGPGSFAAQYHRVALGIGLDGYVAPDLDEAYRLHAAQSGTAPGQFGILAPTPVPVPVVGTQQIQGVVFGALPAQQQVERSNGQLSSKIVVDPPDLEAWRDRLFNVDEMIVLTHEQ